MKTLYKAGILFLLISLNVQAQTWTKVRGDAQADEQLQNIRGCGTFSSQFPVEENQDILFSAEIESNVAVTLLIQAPEIPTRYWKKVAYPRIGEKQTVYAFYNVRNARKLQVNLTISALPNKQDAVTHIHSVKLEPVKLRELNLQRKKEFSGVTSLREPCTIIIPRQQAEGADYAALAAQIQSRLPSQANIVTDEQACRNDGPEILPEFAERHLIIIGNLDSNRAIWPAYTRMLAASDAYYPGPLGYEVRTAVNVLNNGRNHIIIGSSSAEGIRMAVDKFLELLEPELPFLHEIKLDGECRDRVQADIELWKQFPDGPFPQKEAGYHTIRRWYHNAIAYYWTRDPFYRNLARELYKPVLEDMAYTHHYIMEWLYKTWRQVVMTDLHTPEEKAQTEKLLLQNYLELQTGADLTWFRYWTEPYEKLSITSRHVTAPLMCLVETSDYMRNNLELPSPLAELVDFTWDESSRAMRGFIMTNRQDSIPGEPGGGGLEEISLSAFRFALKYQCHEFFNSGKAREWSQKEFFNESNMRDNVLFRHRFNYKMIFSMLAAYFREGSWKYYAEQSSFNVFNQSMFDDRYVCGIGIYQSNIEPRLPEEDLRLGVVRTSLADRLNAQSFNRLFFQVNPEVLDRDPVDMVTFRSRLDDQGAFLALSGTKRYIANPGEIVQFTTQRNAWLHNGWTALYNNSIGVPFERNMLHVNRSRQPDDARAIFSALADLQWSLDIPEGSIQAARLHISPWNGVDWKRAVYAFAPDCYLVHDSIKAMEEDTYDIGVTWNPMFNTEPNTVNALHSSQGKFRFSITCAGKGFALETNTEDFRKNLAAKLNSRFSYHGALQPGQQLGASAMLQVNRNLQLLDLENGQIAISEKGRNLATVSFSDQGFLEINRQRLVASKCSNLMVAGESLFQSLEPVDLYWDFEQAKIWFAAGRAPEKVSIEQNQRAFQLCQQYLDQIPLPTDTAEAAEDTQKDTQKDTPAEVLPEKLWHWSGLTRPQVILTGYQNKQNFDLGEVVPICEIRNIAIEGALAETMQVSNDGQNWREIQLQPVWMPGQTTRNYGETHPTEKYYQKALLEPPQSFRFLKSPVPQQLAFYRSDIYVPDCPLKFIATKPNILVSTEVVKAWPRRYTLDNTSFVNLDHDGKELFQFHTPIGLHELKVLDYPESESIGMVGADTSITFFNQNGAIIRKISVHDDLQKFHQRYGRSNTRQPAAGFPATYALGTWRNPVELVATRYGQLSFYDAKGQLRGVLAGGSYGMQQMLNKGGDFNNDGQDEQLAIGPHSFVHLEGSPEPSVRNPGTHIFWPEVFDKSEHKFPVGWNINFGTWGAKTFVFETIERPESYAVLLITQTFVTVYDTATRRITWSWVALAPVRAAAIRNDVGQECLAVVCQEDRSISLLKWDAASEKPTLQQKISVPDEINAAHIGSDGTVYLAGNLGLYSLHEATLLKRMNGTFTDVKTLPGKLLTAEGNGIVSCWKIEP
ncbi:MAG: hypothetical protein GX946_12095 [Oligosphaeraceae bacterium]|nr:hypothetical protein [Oligosphaeraceae bacterium]